MPRKIRERLYATEGVSFAQTAIHQLAVHCGEVTNRDRAILQHGVALSMNHLQHPLQCDLFRATRFDYRLYFPIPNDHKHAIQQ